MKRLPAAIYVVDPRKERIAIAEARKLVYPLLQLLIPIVIRMKLIMLSLETMMQFVPLN